MNKDDDPGFTIPFMVLCGFAFAFLFGQIALPFADWAQAFGQDRYFTTPVGIQEPCGWIYPTALLAVMLLPSVVGYLALKRNVASKWLFLECLGLAFIGWIPGAYLFVLPHLAAAKMR